VRVFWNQGIVWLACWLATGRWRMRVAVFGDWMDWRGWWSSGGVMTL